MTGGTQTSAISVTTAAICTMIGATSGSTGATSTVTAIATSPLSIHKAINTKPAPEKGTGFTSFITGRPPIFIHARARPGHPRLRGHLFFLQHLRHRRSDLRGRLHNRDPAFRHDLHLRRGSIVRTADDRTRMTHAPSRRRCLPGDEPYHRLPVVVADPARGFGLHTSTDLTDHDDPFRTRIVHQQFHCLLRRRTDDRVAADTYRRRDAQTGLGYLVGGLIGQRTRFADDTDLPLLENESRHNSHLTFPRRDHPRTIGTDQPRALT